MLWLQRQADLPVAVYCVGNDEKQEWDFNNLAFHFLGK
jgi:hypothetical protein